MSRLGSWTEAKRRALKRLSDDSINAGAAEGRDPA